MLDCRYDAVARTLYIRLKKGPVDVTKQLVPGKISLYASFNRKGELLSIEIIKDKKEGDG